MKKKKPEEKKIKDLKIKKKFKWFNNPLTVQTNMNKFVRDQDHQPSYPVSQTLTNR